MLNLMFFSYLRPMKRWILPLCFVFSLCTDVLQADVIGVAQSYLGTPYVAGTLEVEGEERLIIKEDGVDCTTFVELSVARWLTERSDSLTFEQQVQALRYRGGVIDGYLSRLHYFTDWVNENARRGVWHEVGLEGEDPMWVTDTLTLSFMSKHPQSYPYLKKNAWAVDSIKVIEQRYTRYPIHYIGKEFLNLGPKELPIFDGDILALVTTIEGLDVTHLGFAVWKGDTLHLMHASTKQGKVVIDEQPLYDYLKNRKSCPGIRVVRLVGN